MPKLSFVLSVQFKLIPHIYIIKINTKILNNMNIFSCYMNILLVKIKQVTVIFEKGDIHLFILIYVYYYLKITYRSNITVYLLQEEKMGHIY